MVRRMSRDQPPQPPPGQAHFGFRDVAEGDKARLVGNIFSNVAPRYDLMNDLMSAGVHRLWKRDMVAALGTRPVARLLDLAGGTGDIALRVAAGGATPEGAPSVGAVTVCDINPDMLEVGRERAWNRGILAFDWLCGDAEALPLASASFDAVTIAFGIRNVTHVERALAEIARVLKPGGRFLCLEFTPDVTPALRGAYDWFSFRVIPAIGRAVTGESDAYRYLVESIRRFPDPERFAAMITEAGFAGVRGRRLSGGVAALHSAWRV